MTKTFLYSVLIVSLLLLPGFNVAAQNWPMHMNSPEHTGFSTNEPPSNTDIAWSFHTGDFRLYAPPVVYEGVAYVLGPELFAADAETGSRLWSYPIEAAKEITITEKFNWHYYSEWSTPAVYGDRIYIVSSLDNKIVALDRTPRDDIDEGQPDTESVDYDVIWEYKVASENLFGSRSSPLVINDILYVGTAEGNLIALKADPKDEHGESLSTTSLLWIAYIGTRIDSSPAYFDDMIFIGTWDIRHRPEEYVFDINDTYLYVYDATPDDGVDDGLPDPANTSCDLVWRAELGNLTWSSPTIDVSTRTVYIGCTDGKMYAFNIDNGEMVWNYQTGGPIYTTPALADGKVLFGTSEPDNSLYALSSSNGTFIWKYEAGEKVTASPVIAGNTIYSPVMNGRINTLDINGNSDGTTSLLGAVSLPKPVRATPALANGHLYIACWDGYLYCLGNVWKEDLAISSFAVEGDSREVTISFAIINLGDGKILNSTVYLSDGQDLIYNETIGPIFPHNKNRVFYTQTEPEPGEHYYKIELDYIDEYGGNRTFYFNSTVTIEKYTIPSFIPAPNTGMIIMAVSWAVIITAVTSKRRNKKYEKKI